MLFGNKKKKNKDTRKIGELKGFYFFEEKLACFFN
jgi:hypothetical protein